MPMTINDLQYDTEDSEEDPDYEPECYSESETDDEECKVCMECEIQKLKLIDMCSELREKWIEEKTKVINLKKVIETFMTQICSLGVCSE